MKANPQGFPHCWLIDLRRTPYISCMVFVFWTRHIDHCLNIYRKQMLIYRFQRMCTLLYTHIPSRSFEGATWSTHARWLCNSNHLHILHCLAFPVDSECLTRFPHGVAIIYIHVYNVYVCMCIVMLIFCCNKITNYLPLT